MTAILRSSLIMMLLAGCSARPDVPRHADFEVGATRAEIRAEFGSPVSTESIQKRGDAIWGAVETFWGSVPDGSTVEIWSYPSRESVFGNGTTELYFIDGSDTVNGTGFNPEGVIYETTEGGQATATGEYQLMPVLHGRCSCQILKIPRGRESIACLQVISDGKNGRVRHFEDAAGAA